MTRSIDGIRAYMVSGLLAAGLLGCAWPARSQPPLDLLMDRIVQRNAIGDAVALSKWDSGKPVLDQAREAAVLQSVRDQAPAHGLDADDAARFFGAQIEANKSVQYALLSHWHERGHAPNTARPDLTALRARLDQLQGELLDALADVASTRSAPDCPASTARAAAHYAEQWQLDALHRAALVRGLGDFCH
ncbi:chorismate mutase [Xanthomonas euvesicatoria pv. euvesicatoria]|uniref:Chorismate mutase n=2 Tax=Xanthomonas euvesicatoria TaxID=456327 RepID=Q3BP17_XANE5|nr:MULTISPECIES: chorismate mutase [Xanthomonas]OHX23594.1 chorismate mutase [Xanthomonas alfalfae]AEO43786.1 chorismate mutase [Xanthomonas euvesicatoria pv. citrumelo F1]AOY67108.1 chorismate mutase [Xanthomonas euvesicatoria pv. vesicatoria str. 85-10]APO89303.1 chorismate mutase [Xanthomonas euvesicatoria]KHL57534.1 chorismate mutase [Xanthomonas euvesicatoria]